MKGEDEEERLKSGEPDACVCKRKCIGSAQRYARIPKDFGSFPLPQAKLGGKPPPATFQPLKSKTRGACAYRKVASSFPWPGRFRRQDFDANKFRLIAQIDLTTMRPR